MPLASTAATAANARREAPRRARQTAEMSAAQEARLASSCAQEGSASAKRLKHSAAGAVVKEASSAGPRVKQAAGPRVASAAEEPPPKEPRLAGAQTGRGAQPPSTLVVPTDAMQEDLLAKHAQLSQRLLAVIKGSGGIARARMVPCAAAAGDSEVLQRVAPSHREKDEAGRDPQEEAFVEGDAGFDGGIRLEGQKVEASALSEKPASAVATPSQAAPTADGIPSPCMPPGASKDQFWKVSAQYPALPHVDVIAAEPFLKIVGQAGLSSEEVQAAVVKWVARTGCKEGQLRAEASALEELAQVVVAARSRGEQACSIFGRLKYAAVAADSAAPSVAACREWRTTAAASLPILPGGP